MIGSKIVIDGSKKVIGLFANRWHALVMPDETIKGKQLENLEKAVDIAEKLKKSQQETIDWKKKAYIEMGVTKTKIREELLPEIEKSTDPLSVIKKLIEKGAVQAVEELPSDETTPSELPDPDGDSERDESDDDDLELAGDEVE